MTTGASREELDHLYSPSRWSKRLSADVVVDHYVKTLEQATQTAQKTLRCDLNVVYDQTSGQTLDIYYPLGDEAVGDVFIYFHGGYWQALGIEHSGFMAVPFTINGITVVPIGYDLAPKATMTTIVEQCRRGCAYVKSKFSRERIFVGGHSAGGHLTACMLDTDWSQYGMKTCPFAGAVMLSGVYELGPIQRTRVNEPLQLSDTEVQQFSPQRNINQLKLPPTFKKCFFANGEQESPEFKRQVEEYIQGLRMVGLECEHHELAGDDHFSLTEKMSEQDSPINQLLLCYFREGR